MPFLGIPVIPVVFVVSYFLLNHPIPLIILVLLFPSMLLLPSCLTCRCAKCAVTIQAFVKACSHLAGFSTSPAQPYQPSPEGELFIFWSQCLSFHNFSLGICELHHQFHQLAVCWVVRVHPPEYHFVSVAVSIAVSVAVSTAGYFYSLKACRLVQ